MTPENWNLVKQFAPIELAEFLSLLNDALVREGMSDGRVRTEIIYAATPVVIAKLLEEK